MDCDARGFEAGAQAFDRLPDRDVYAPEVGFAAGFPAARDPVAGQAWLAHCYGAMGVGRDNAPDSGNGSHLYVVIGHAPRGLDRNITVAGRVVQGMPLLSAMPRSAEPLGMYKTVEERTPVRSIRVAADLPASERVELQALRTDSTTFAALVEARRNRIDDWYKVPAGAADLCSVSLPVRSAP